MLGKTDRSRVVIIMSPLTSSWSLTVWKIWESHLQRKKIIREDQERGWLNLWVSMPKKGQIYTKRQGMPSEMSVRRTFQRLSGSLRNCLIKFMRGGVPTRAHQQLLLPSKTACEVYDESWFPQLARLPCKNGNYWYKTYSDLACLLYGRERNIRVPSGKTLSQVCSTDEEKSIIIIVDESSTEEREP